MPVHWAEKKKSKPDKAKNIEILESFHGSKKYHIVDVGLLKSYKFPLNFHSIHKVNPTSIPFSPHARLKCQNCGLFNRAALCPPRLGISYPHFRTLDSAKKWISTASVYVIVWQNDGTKPWKVDWDDVSHIEFKKIGGRRLKGVEHASAKAIANFMKSLEKDISSRLPQGFKVYGLIPGHCDICARYCPLRSLPKAICKKGGMPSLEAIGIDVYKLLNNLGIDWRYPVSDNDHLTQVTALVINNSAKSKIRVSKIDQKRKVIFLKK